jgi:hypothetical protein
MEQRVKVQRSLTESQTRWASPFDNKTTENTAWMTKIYYPGPKGVISCLGAELSTMNYNNDITPMKFSVVVDIRHNSRRSHSPVSEDANFIVWHQSINGGVCLLSSPRHNLHGNWRINALDWRVWPMSINCDAATWPPWVKFRLCLFGSTCLLSLSSN